MNKIYWRPDTSWTERNSVALINKAKGKKVINRNSTLRHGYVMVYEIGYGWLVYYGTEKPSLVEVL